MKQLVLSCFPGIGLLDRAFEEEGFCVVRGPDCLWGGDIRSFHPPQGRFDGVIGGPPCQAFSPLAAMVKANGLDVAENLIPEFERCIREAQPRWFVMENVKGAPLPVVPGYVVSDRLLNNRWVEEAPAQNRVRRFSFGVWNARVDLHPRMAALESQKWEPAVLASGGYRVCPGAKGKTVRKLGYKSRTAAAAAAAVLQGLPPDFDLPGFTVRAKCKAIGNGVPLPMGRAVARAVREALGLEVAA